jgi:hypothetical protein
MAKIMFEMLNGNVFEEDKGSNENACRWANAMMLNEDIVSVSVFGEEDGLDVEILNLRKDLSYGKF